ncbi:MAG TPA: hypothetical protein VEC01_19650 [Noviherbaspirillum sp.]|uniref:hypothetical protein n=1 Tax=Noviherbaspirillum sp. TaxID=1926288 RepID=UPI002D55207F|nr:hypothetical protein [Noviherbaspirillum sp.]HYD97546.1 hypothetical protein [Noviherbaspirillum sp.]
MTILFFHQAFPGQYLHLAAAAAARGHQLVALSTPPAGHDVSGIEVNWYRPGQVALQESRAADADPDTGKVQTEHASHAAFGLRAGGFTPDLICTHAGTEEGTFLKNVWPDARLLNYAEFYYHALHAVRP